jgi:hypothetical protein
MTPARFVAVSAGAISNDKFALCEKLTAICRGYAVHKLGAKVDAEMAQFGNARVSTDGESLAAQLAELKAMRTDLSREDQRRPGLNRRQLNRLIAALDRGV